MSIVWCCAGRTDISSVYLRTGVRIHCPENSQPGERQRIYPSHQNKSSETQVADGVSVLGKCLRNILVLSLALLPWPLQLSFFASETFLETSKESKVEFKKIPSQQRGERNCKGDGRPPAQGWEQQLTEHSTRGSFEA